LEGGPNKGNMSGGRGSLRGPVATTENPATGTAYFKTSNIHRDGALGGVEGARHIRRYQHDPLGYPEGYTAQVTAGSIRAIPTRVHPALTELIGNAKIGSGGMKSTQVPAARLSLGSNYPATTETVNALGPSGMVNPPWDHENGRRGGPSADREPPGL